MSDSASTLRLDPEYFQKQHLQDEKYVKEAPELFNLFKDFGLTVDASAFYPSIEGYYDQGDLPFLRVADVDTVIDHQSCTTIPAELCSRFPTLAKVKPGDIVFTKGGSVARIGLVTHEAAASRDLIFINSSKLTEANRVFLYIYFQTKFFNRALIRSSSQTAQPHLTITLVRELPIFIGTSRLKDSCLSIVQNSYASRAQAIQLLDEADKKLLRNLNLENWQPPNPLSYFSSSANAFATERFDAEYFHPSKTAAQTFLQALPGKPLNAMFGSIRELWQPENAPANEMVRNYDLNDALSPFLDNTKTPTYPAEIASTKKRLQKGDIVVSRLRSYLKEIAVVQTDGKEPMVCSTEFIVLRPKAGAIPVEALLVYLRSTLPQLIFKWSQDGSNHPRFDEKELLNLHVPDVIASISQELSDSVNAATRARQRAAELLEAAKRAVEIAIEDSEAAALAYLKSVEEKPAP